MPIATGSAMDRPCQWCNNAPAMYCVRELNKDKTVTITNGCPKCTSERNYTSKTQFPFVIAFNRITLT